MPTHREDSAPIFDGSDPCEIERYFDDLEFLFLKHSISDSQEKKRAAVRYLSLAPEQLWRTTPAFSNPTRSYEDFKAEVLALYPEATGEHEYTRAAFKRLVTDRARTPIRSEMELGEFYHAFLLTSRTLISQGRLGVPEQRRALLASFEPHLGADVQTRLERVFPTTSQRTPTTLMRFMMPLYMPWRGSAPRPSYKSRARSCHPSQPVQPRRSPSNRRRHQSSHRRSFRKSPSSRRLSHHHQVLRPFGSHARRPQSLRASFRRRRRRPQPHTRPSSHRRRRCTHFRHQHRSFHLHRPTLVPAFRPFQVSRPRRPQFRRAKFRRFVHRPRHHPHHVSSRRRRVRHFQ